MIDLIDLKIRTNLSFVPAKWQGESTLSEAHCELMDELRATGNYFVGAIAVKGSHVEVIECLNKLHDEVLGDMHCHDAIWLINDDGHIATKKQGDSWKMQFSCYAGEATLDLLHEITKQVKSELVS